VNAIAPPTTRLGRGTVLLLLTGRAASRGAQYLTGLVLLAVWGPAEFARYAAPLGVAIWLFALSAAGTERAALVLIGGSGGYALERVFIWFALAPFGLALAGWAATALAARAMTALAAATAVDYAAAAALWTGLGCVSVLVALFRLRGMPRVDAAAYLSIAAGYGLVAVLATVAGFSVGAVLTTLVLVVVAVSAALLGGLRFTRPAGADTRSGAEPTPDAGWRHRPVVRAARSSALLAAGDLLSLVGLSVLYAELGIAAPAEQTTVFYFCMVISTAFGTLGGYLLRLRQGAILAWLAADRALAHAWIRRLRVGVIVVGGAVTAAVAGAVLARGSTPTVIGAALLAEILIYLAVLVVAFMVESVDDRARAWSALSSIVSLVVTVAAGWFVVPVGGAAGALLALCLGTVVRCPFLTPGAAVPAEPAEPAEPVRAGSGQAGSSTGSAAPSHPG
jgi:hypothetical protein